MYQIITIKITQSRTKNRANLTTSSIDVMNNNKMCNTLTKTYMKKERNLRTNIKPKL